MLFSDDELYQQPPWLRLEQKKLSTSKEQTPAEFPCLVDIGIRTFAVPLSLQFLSGKPPQINAANVHNDYYCLIPNS